MNQQTETIGRCELCGLVVHHLIGGECPACRAKARRLVACDSRINGRTHGARLAGNIVIEYDTASNPILRLAPVAQGECRRRRAL